jgi:hypothetical protein
MGDRRWIGYLLACVVLVIMSYVIFTNAMPEGLFMSEGMVASSIDKEEYLVCEEYPNKHDAANILAEINRMYVRLITHLKRKKMDTRWASSIEYLVSNYNPTVLGEHIPSNLKYTSYVARKGQKIRLCLRTPEDRMKFHDMNTLRFVALHELAHMMTRSYGHEHDFWDTFRFILAEADSLEMIKLIDYRLAPQRYCGIIIESSPAFT